MEVQGHPQYIIYEDGNVWSMKSNIFLKNRRHSCGYVRYRMDKKDVYAHRLLAIHYIPNPDNLPMVDHINRDRTDNRLCNLRWVSHAENNDNKCVKKSAKSGFRGISHIPRRESPKKWRFQRRKEQFYVETKAQAFWIKFYFHVNNL